MTLLVTECAGFSGSAAIRGIDQNTLDSDVNDYKSTHTGNLGNLREVESFSRYIFELFDICNRTNLERVFSEHQIDVIMHLFTESHLDCSIDGPPTLSKLIMRAYILFEVARSYGQNWNKAGKLSTISVPIKYTETCRTRMRTGLYERTCQLSIVPCHYSPKPPSIPRAAPATPGKLAERSCTAPSCQPAYVKLQETHPRSNNIGKAAIDNFSQVLLKWFAIKIELAPPTYSLSSQASEYFILHFWCQCNLPLNS